MAEVGGEKYVLWGAGRTLRTAIAFMVLDTATAAADIQRSRQSHRGYYQSVHTFISKFRELFNMTFPYLIFDFTKEVKIVRSTFANRKAKLGHYLYAYEVWMLTLKEAGLIELGKTEASIDKKAGKL